MTPVDAVSGTLEPVRRILALDGGGVRGAISIAFLERVETLLGEQAGQPVKLCDHFDLIGGTSTGAIIATALALGFSAADLKAMYFDLAPKVFRRSVWRPIGFRALFDGEKLLEEMRKQIGDLELGTDKLRTGLAIVTKRVDTDSAWIVTNNPAARYWDDPADGSYVGNRHYRLPDLVRASAAAPHYFAPQEIPIVEGEEAGLFVDGAVTPHNNSALALLQVSRIPGYGYSWPLGEERLFIMSIGTGKFRKPFDSRHRRLASPALMFALNALRNLINDSGTSVLTTMEMLGRSPEPAVINSEIGAVPCIVPEPLFTFQRYDLPLDAGWLAENLGRTMAAAEINALRELDAASAIPLAHELATAHAQSAVKREHVELFWSKSDKRKAAEAQPL